MFTWKMGRIKKMLADILSVIKNDVNIRFNGNVIALNEWGHQYIKEMLKQLITLNRDNKEAIEKLEKHKFDEKRQQELECVEDECIRFMFDSNSELDVID